MAKKAAKHTTSFTSKLPMGLGYWIARNLWWMAAAAVFIVSAALNQTVADVVRTSVAHALNNREILNLDAASIGFMLLTAFIMLGSMSIVPLKKMERVGITLLKLSLIPLLMMNVVTMLFGGEPTKDTMLAFVGLIATLLVLFDIRDMYDHNKK